MGFERVEIAGTGAETRRTRRAAELASTRRGSRTRARTRGPVPTHWIPRLALLCALAGITVVLPLTDNVSPSQATFVADAQASEANLPATVDALTAVTVETLPPATIASTNATATRADVAASRSLDRAALPGCDQTAPAPGENGQLSTGDLCTLWDGEHQLRADAASALAELNLAFRATFNRDLCVTDAYRTIAEQRFLKSTKGGIAATPGRSNHGWGLAVDLCSIDARGPGWTWLNENGVVYGWENPAWALSGGNGPHEPWHWEYTRGVIADGEYYGS